jgi:hypothetical protein
MNIALTHTQAAASARFCGKSAFVRAVVLGCAVACASAPVLAGTDRDGDGPRNPPQQQAQPANREQPHPQAQPRAERIAPPQQPQRAEQRQFDSHAADARAEEQRRQQAQQQAQQQEQGTRRGGRLTPDERRELRRQINEAGIDLYPNTPPRH